MHSKTVNKTCVIIKGSDQPVHQPSMPRVLVYPSFKSLEAAEGTCNQRRLGICAVWSESSLIPCAFYNLQAIHRGINKNPCHTGWMYSLLFSVCWSHRSYFSFCKALAHIFSLDGTDTLGRFSTIVCKGDNFYDFLFAFQHTELFLKSGLI